MQKLLYSVSFLCLLLLLASCGVPKNYEHAVYLKDSITEAERTVITKPTLIMPGDRLNINITAINKEAAEAFNAPQLPTTSETQEIQGYLVDSSGNILLLQLGKVHVSGLTPGQVQQNLQLQLQDYLKGAVVTVNIANFRINVLGEVARPGMVDVPEGKLTILEAISKSGDLTLFAKRDSILIIRENNGKREFGRVSLASNEIFLSPYYNLQQNDVIYIEPDRTKFIANDYVMNRNVRNLGIIITILSATLLLVNIFK